ncbi:MAG: hypothetical protein CR993_00785 [Rhodobacterales bacterium]|nr:MAG: hypothetical protein CR993_00785 [Rhodobacterales bacterium]
MNVGLSNPRIPEGTQSFDKDWLGKYAGPAERRRNGQGWRGRLLCHSDMADRVVKLPRWAVILCLDVPMLHLEFRPSLFDRLTINHFRRSLRKLGLRGLDENLNEVLRSETAFMIDRTTQSHILFGACILASYRMLRRSGLSEKDAKRTLAPIVCGDGRKTQAVIMWIVCNLTRDLFRQFESYSRDQLPRKYGRSFKFVHSTTSEGFVSCVTLCGYKTFLARHRATELLSVFCEWDKVWIDMLPPTIGFKRPQTQADGAKSCIFEFQDRSSKPPFV